MGNFFGTNGNNTLSGTANADNMFGRGGNDQLAGLGSNDRLNGGTGTDTLNGGAGVDTADYSSGILAGQAYTGATAGVTVNLALAGAQNTGGAGSDTLVGVENLIGTNFNDVLTGTSANNLLLGLGGNDTLNAGSGNDTLNGGTGSDTADYGNIIIGGTTFTGATAGVTVNLALTGTQNTGGAGIDKLVGIENLTGTNVNDVLTGNSGNNVLFGLKGNDTLNGGAGNDTLEGGGGNDILDGGTGSDTASYTTATAGITVSLDTPFPSAQNTGGAGIDTLINIENLIGSKFNDDLTIAGEMTTSTADGGEGNDKLFAHHSNAILNGGAGNDWLGALDSGGTLNGGDGNDELVGQTGQFVLNGGAGNDVLQITDSEDPSTMNGGAGTDSLDLTDAGPASVTCDYNAVSDSLAGAGRDTIIGFDGNRDQIDLRDIDANALVAGNQAFTWTGATPGGAGTLWYTGGILNGNVDGDAAPEFQVQLVGAPALSVGGTGSDILL